MPPRTVLRRTTTTNLLNYLNGAGAARALGTHPAPGYQRRCRYTQFW
jgi:hypothetical protein